MKKYFIAALSLAALVACSKDELPADPVLDSSQKSVSISIANMASDTRAAGGTTTPATAETKASTTMDRVYILFVDAAGKIIDVKGNLQGTGPFVFHKVSALATKVAAVGNVTTAPTIGGDLSTYETLWKTEDVDAAYTDLVVYAEPDTMTRNGNATCTDDQTGETYPLYSASITIKPYMARIEISQISCTDFGGANVGYDAIGVTGMTLAGGDVTNSGDTSDKPYTFAALGSFADDAALMAGSTTNYVLKPVAAGEAAQTLTAGTGKVWSWNIVPQKVSNLTTGLYVSGDGYTTSVPVREVVINSYKTGSTDIESFAGGNIYQFAINFSYNNIEAVEDYLCAEVTVSIDPWTIVPTEVGFKTNP